MSRYLKQLIAFVRETPAKFCRDFGALLAGIFLVIGTWQPTVGFNFRPIFVGIAVLLGILSFFRPEILRPIASLWRGLAELLHFVMSPMILFVIYFFILTPVGVVLRIFKWDPLRLKMNKAASSHWIRRTPPGPSTDSYQQQF